MLKNVPQILPPALLKSLCEMGHTDSIVLSDANFPAETMGRNATVVRCDASGVPEILDAILRLIPLDAHIETPVTLMRVDEGVNVETPIWNCYKEIVSNYDARGAKAFAVIDRFAFYDRAKQACTVVYTGEKALYAPLILQKGVLMPEDFVPVYGR